MSKVFSGLVEIKDASGQRTVALDGNNGDVRIGGGGEAGDLVVADANDKQFLWARGRQRDVLLGPEVPGEQRIRLDADEGDIVVLRRIGGVQREVLRFDASHAALYLGSKGNEGDVIVRNAAGDTTVHIDGGQGDIYVRRRIAGQQRDVLRFDASHAALYLGSKGNEGDLIIRDGANRDVLHFDSAYAALYIGANGNEGDVIVRDGTGKERVRIDGASGDIKLHGADCAEEFDSTHAVEPGTVLVIEDDGRLAPCTAAYDRRVAGVVSGAGQLNPGLILGYSGASADRTRVALAGRVECRVDGTIEPIDVGDLLTTSTLPGHAMRASDPARAFGAVIGKAMRSTRDVGRVPILATLQ